MQAHRDDPHGGVKWFKNKKELREYLDDFREKSGINATGTLLEEMKLAGVLEEEETSDFDAKFNDTEQNVRVRNIAFWLSLRLTALPSSVTQDIIPYLIYEQAQLRMPTDVKTKTDLMDIVDKMVDYMANTKTISLRDKNLFSLGKFFFKYMGSKANINVFVMLLISKYIRQCHPYLVDISYRLLDIKPYQDEERNYEHNTWLDYSVFLYTINKVFLLVANMLQNLANDNEIIIKTFTSEKIVGVTRNVKNAAINWLVSQLPAKVSAYVSLELLTHSMGNEAVIEGFAFAKKEDYRRLPQQEAIDFLFHFSSSNDSANKEVPLPYAVLVLLTTRIPNSEPIQGLLSGLQTVLDVKPKNTSEMEQGTPGVTGMFGALERVASSVKEDLVNKFWDALHDLLKDLREIVSQLIKKYVKENHENYISFEDIASLIAQTVMSTHVDTMIQILMNWQISRIKLFATLDEYIIQKIENIVPIDAQKLILRRISFTIRKSDKDKGKVEEHMGVIAHDLSTVVEDRRAEKSYRAEVSDFVTTAEMNRVTQQLNLYGATTFNHRFNKEIQKVLSKERVKDKIDALEARRYAFLLDRAFHVSRKIMRGWRRLKFHAACSRKSKSPTETEKTTGCRWKSMALKIIRTIAAWVEKDKGYTRRTARKISQPHASLKSVDLIESIVSRRSTENNTTYAEIRCAMFCLTFFVRLDAERHTTDFPPKWFLHANALLYEFLRHPRLPNRQTLERLSDANLPPRTPFDDTNVSLNTSKASAWFFHSNDKGILNKDSIAEGDSFHHKIVGTNPKTVFLVVGPEGSGKSTFVDLLVNSNEPTRSRYLDIAVYQGKAKNNRDIFIIDTPPLVDDPKLFNNKITYSVDSLFDVLNYHKISIDHVFFVYKNDGTGDPAEVKSLLDKLTSRLQDKVNIIFSFSKHTTVDSNAIDEDNEFMKNCLVKWEFENKNSSTQEYFLFDVMLVDSMDGNPLTKEFSDRSYQTRENIEEIGKETREFNTDVLHEPSHITTNSCTIS